MPDRRRHRRPHPADRKLDADAEAARARGSARRLEPAAAAGAGLDVGRFSLDAWERWLNLGRLVVARCVPRAWAVGLR